MIDYSKHSLVIELKLLASTDIKGSRLKLTCPRLKESITLSPDYSFDSGYSQAFDYLVNDLNLDVVSWGSFKDNYIFMIASVDGSFIFKGGK